MDQKEIRLTTMILTVVSNNGRNRTRDLMGDVQFNETRALEEIVPWFADRPEPEQLPDGKP